MSHSFYKIWLHIIFGTKHRMPLINSGIKPKLHAYLKDQLQKLDCSVKAINGMPDHIHLLISMNPKLSIADVVKQIKGSSSHWVNHQNLSEEKFSWQTGYGVFSVSESQISKVVKYIEEQKVHHKKTTFIDEYNQFLKLHNLDING